MYAPDEPAGLTLRLAAQCEREALEALQWRASLALEDYRDELLSHPDAIVLPPEQIERGDVLVAEMEDEIVGFAAIVVHPDQFELDALFVEPQHWRRGIGSALVDAATLRARQVGRALIVVANPAALTFYEHCGFAVEDEVATRFGPAVRLSR